MITLNGVEKSYAGRTLFGDVSLQVNREDRLGLVGPNGAGKSTLFNLILGEESTDKGSVEMERNLGLGFLPQENVPVGGETVLELALSISPEFMSLRRQVSANEHVDAEVFERFDELGGAQLEAKAKRILAGLSFRESDHDRLQGAGFEFVSYFGADGFNPPDFQFRVVGLEHLTQSVSQFFSSPQRVVHGKPK